MLDNRTCMCYNDKRGSSKIFMSKQTILLFKKTSTGADQMNTDRMNERMSTNTCDNIQNHKFD